MASTLCSRDTCQNKVSADWYHMTILWAHVELIEVTCFFKLIAAQVQVVFQLASIGLHAQAC